MALTYQYRHAAEPDLTGVAQVFAAAFPESIAHYFQGSPGTHVIAEPFALCLAAEPDGFWVAEAPDGQIAGYIFSPAQTSRLQQVAVTQGFVFRWLWRWISGQYHIGWSPVRALVANQLEFWTSAREPKARAEARILSIAVHPAHQGRGIARALCTLGLERLDALGAAPVRLEVRPENLPAFTLYSHLGFTETGRTRDSQGDWVVMLRTPPGRSPTGQ